MTPEQIERLKRLCELPAKDVPCQEALRALFAEWEERGREVERLSEQLRLCTVPDGWETWRRNAEVEIERLWAEQACIDIWLNRRRPVTHESATLRRMQDRLIESENEAIQARQRSQQAEDEIERLRDCESEAVTVLKECCQQAEARLAEVVKILRGNLDSANRCLDEPDHPAWVHAQAHATVSVCETALAAAQPEEESRT